nr:MAG TPA: hypothetical protein [Caudoviricetes sp.]
MKAIGPIYILRVVMQLIPHSRNMKMRFMLCKI